MAQMFNPVSQFKAFKQGSIDPANPVAEKLSETAPWAKQRKQLLAYEQPDEPSSNLNTTTVQQTPGVNNANRTTSLAAKQLLGA